MDYPMFNTSRIGKNLEGGLQGNRSKLEEDKRCVVFC